MSGRAFLYVASSLGLATAAHASVEDGIKLLEQGKIAESVKVLQAAYTAGEPDGAFYIGRLFELGLGADKDMKRAAALYAAAAGKNSAKAKNRLGLMYLDGEVVLQDYDRAAELLCSAAEAGEPNAQFNCGLLYAQGKGFARDPAKAVVFWEKAAKQNNVAAINFLGQAYLKGEGVPKDDAKAFGYFRRTADAGNPMGLVEVAKAYQAGRGTETDPVKAYAFANLAATRGEPDAAGLRDAVASALPAEKLASAQQFSRDWKAVPIEDAGR